MTGVERGGEVGEEEWVGRFWKISRFSISSVHVAGIKLPAKTIWIKIMFRISLGVSGCQYGDAGRCDGGALCGEYELSQAGVHDCLPSVGWYEVVQESQR